MGTPINLDGLNYVELQTLLESVRGKAEQIRSSEIQKTADEVKALIASKGFALEEVLPLLSAAPSQSGRKGRADSGKKVAPKYRDPANPENTWAGRGIRPKWLTEKLAAGAKLEDFAV